MSSHLATALRNHMWYGTLSDAAVGVADDAIDMAGENDNSPLTLMLLCGVNAVR